MKNLRLQRRTARVAGSAERPPRPPNRLRLDVDLWWDHNYSLRSFRARSQTRLSTDDLNLLLPSFHAARTARNNRKFRKIRATTTLLCVKEKERLSRLRRQHVAVECAERRVSSLFERRFTVGENLKKKKQQNKKTIFKLQNTFRSKNKRKVEATALTKGNLSGDEGAINI